MKNNIKETIGRVSDILKSSFPYQIYSDICVFLVFLKYILDNEKLPYNKTSFELQRIFDRGILNEKALINASITLEDQYKLPQSSLLDLAQNCIRLNDMQKSYDVLTKVFHVLNEINCTDRSGEIVEALKEIIYASAASFPRIVGEKITSQPLSNLIKELISVEDGDDYADFTYGIGISTLEVIKDKTCSITGYEINRSSVAVAGMLLIISGRENINLIMGDILDIKVEENSFDKIVAMPPWGMRIQEFSPEITSIMEQFHLPQKRINMDMLILLKSVLALKEGGIAIITVTPNFLFSNTVIDKAIRKEIVKKNLNTVIQLPNLYYGTIISTIVLILEKNKKSDNILFIDASTNKYFTFFDKSAKPIANLTKLGIDKIKEIYEKRKIEEGVSNVVTTKTIEDNDFLLTLVKYIKVKNKKKVISNKDIDKRLGELYRELKEILDMEGLL